MPLKPVISRQNSAASVDRLTPFDHKRRGSNTTDVSQATTAASSHGHGFQLSQPYGQNLKAPSVAGRRRLLDQRKSSHASQTPEEARVSLAAQIAANVAKQNLGRCDSRKSVCSAASYSPRSKAATAHTTPTSHCATPHNTPRSASDSPGYRNYPIENKVWSTQGHSLQPDKSKHPLRDAPPSPFVNNERSLLASFAAYKAKVRARANSFPFCCCPKRQAYARPPVAAKQKYYEADSLLPRHHQDKYNYYVLPKKGPSDLYSSYQSPY